MTDLHAEALDYPVEYREAALELLVQKQILDAELHEAAERTKVLRHRAMLAGRRWTWVGVLIAVVAITCVFTGLVDGAITSVISACGLFVTLIAAFVATRSGQELDRISRRQMVVSRIEADLMEIRHGVVDDVEQPDEVRSRIAQLLDDKYSTDAIRSLFFLIFGVIIFVWILVSVFQL